MDVERRIKMGNVGNVQGVAMRKCQRCPAASLRAEGGKEEALRRRKRREDGFSVFLFSNLSKHE
jgi:hypothetical protein